MRTESLTFQENWDAQHGSLICGAGLLGHVVRQPFSDVGVGLFGLAGKGCFELLWAMEDDYGI